MGAEPDQQTCRPLTPVGEGAPGGALLARLPAEIEEFALRPACLSFGCFLLEEERAVKWIFCRATATSLYLASAPSTPKHLRKTAMRDDGRPEARQRAGSARGARFCQGVRAPSGSLPHMDEQLGPARMPLSWRPQHLACSRLCCPAVPAPLRKEQRKRTG